jgi:site-specific DNA recombinase
VKVTRPLADINKTLEELQTQLFKLASSNADFDKVDNEVHRLRN